LRQINTYKSYSIGSDPFLIYSPDTKFKDAFESQGVQIVSPEDIGL
jgi:hypothetical protein